MGGWKVAIGSLGLAPDEIDANHARPVAAVFALTLLGGCPHSDEPLLPMQGFTPFAGHVRFVRECANNQPCNYFYGTARGTTDLWVGIVAGRATQEERLFTYARLQDGQLLAQTVEVQAGHRMPAQYLLMRPRGAGYLVYGVDVAKLETAFLDELVQSGGLRREGSGRLAVYTLTTKAALVRLFGALAVLDDETLGQVSSVTVLTPVDAAEVRQAVTNDERRRARETLGLR